MKGAIYSFMSGLGIGIFIAQYAYSIFGKPHPNIGVLFAFVFGVSFVWAYWAIRELRQ